MALVTKLTWRVPSEVTSSLPLTPVSLAQREVGAIGGVVFAGINNNVNLGLMFTVFIYGSAAATLGGFDSPGGAVIGGLAIGVIENLASGYFPEWVGQEMKVAVAFIVIIVVLLFKPSGLFGTAKVERV